MAQYVAMPSDRPPPSCPKCEKPMKHVRTIPGLGPHPELLAFYCADCHHAETIEGGATRNS
jgi:hypothetical protein